jgi:lipooligosaccharide transport system ATP-binding protein
LDIIVAENLTKRFGELVAVDGISFAVREGEMFGFLGPNGAGKTTTMRMIQCVSPKNSGKLLVAGMDVEAEPRKIKHILGISPQEENLDPDFTVVENLVTYSRYFGITRKDADSRSDKWLDFFQLQGKRDTLIDKLSGGMKRRLLLARAMLNEPRILILDEPTVGLDPQARHLIWDLLRQLRSQGITIILTTHYMEEAAQLCDRLVIMDNGKILAKGRPRELVEKYVATNVIETANRPEVKACAERYKQAVQIEAEGDMVHIFTNEPKEILSHLMNECTIESTTVRETTLEDVFLKLTGRMLRE